MTSASSQAPAVCLGTKPSPELFGKWAKKRDIFLHPDAAFLVPTKTMGYGVFARKPLPAGTVVVSCPATSAVSPYVEPSAEAPSIGILRSCAAAQKDNVLLVALRLLAELHRKRSPWAPWLEVCPPMPHHFFALTPAQAAVLGVESVSGDHAELGDANDPPSSSGPSLPATWTSVSQQLREIDVVKRWRAARAIMMAHPEQWPAPSPASFALFCECLAQVFSRNFHREEVQGREGPYLLPGLDILNHSFGSNTVFEIRGGGRKHAATFTVVTSRALKAGEQVLGSYGRIGAARFACEFQFVTSAEVREDVIRFSTEALISIVLTLKAREAAVSTIATRPAPPVADLRKDLENRVERLQRMGILYDEGLFLSRPYPEDADSPTRAGSERVTSSAAAARREEVQKQQQTLVAVCYMLLSVDAAGFDDLYHRISRSWQPKISPEVKACVCAVLEAKKSAAAEQAMRVSEVFQTEGNKEEEEQAGCGANATRVTLLQRVLTSEQEVLAAYQSLVQSMD